MSLYITSLNSGSNGNCYYVGNEREAVLVDAGISCREIEKRLGKLRLSIRNVKSVFISHEHIDHIRGIEVLSKKYKLPVYITPSTLKNSRLVLDKDLIRSFKADKPVSVGSLEVIPFVKHHDAVEPYSFMVEEGQVRIGVFTDIGKPCERLINYFKQCHACFLESNYDEQMLEQGGYPVYLKNRIRGGKGHLSNLQALELFLKHRPPYMSHLILSHLSKNNNTPELVHELFIKHAKRTNIIVASRYHATPVYTIINADHKLPETKNKTLQWQGVQMSLFE